MEMHQIRYFLALCEARNFTRAAEKCAVSQPALTKAIKLLEDELGGPLFLRDSRPLELTNLARALEDRFTRLWGLTGEIKTTARSFLDLQKARATIGVVSSLGEERLKSIAALLQREHPQFSISVKYAAQACLLRDLAQGVLEVAIVADVDLPSAGVDGAPLWRERYGVAMPHHHRLARQALIRWEDLDAESYIARIHCERDAAFQAELARRGVNMIVHLQSDQEDMCRRLVAAGLGLSIMPEGIADPSIAFRPFADGDLVRTIVIAHIADRPLSPMAAAIRQSVLTLDHGAKAALSSQK